MDSNEALNLIKKALHATNADFSEESINLDTDLIFEGILDSLDAMSFLFELEGIIDKKIVEIDEDFDDFKVKNFINILENY